MTRPCEGHKGIGDYTLVGKSKGLASLDFPKVPATSSAERGEEKTNTFALQTPQDKRVSDDLRPTTEEEENEIDIAYTMELLDEDDVLREELLFAQDVNSEVLPSAILARDLECMVRWSKHDEALEEEDPGEVEATIGKVQGTDLMEKYAEHLKQQEGKLLRFLAAVQQMEDARLADQASSSRKAGTIHDKENMSPEGDTRTLDYYL